MSSVPTTPHVAVAPGLTGNSAAEQRTHLIAFAVMALIFALAPLVVYPVFMMKVMCFALFACAFNLLIGFGGLLSFGHAMFWVLPATLRRTRPRSGASRPNSRSSSAPLRHAAGLAGRHAGDPPPGHLFRDDHAGAGADGLLLLPAGPFTGGEDGIQAVPRGRLFGFIDMSQPLAMYALVLAIFLGGFAFIYRVVHSPFGQVLKAIRENEQRAISLGYDTDRFKLVAFVLSATLAGLAGATKALVFQLASLTDVHWSMSGEVVLMTLLGGLGTVFGPVVGAAVIITMQNYLAQLGAWVTVVQGVIFVICVLAFRRGIVGELGAWLKKSL